MLITVRDAVPADAMAMAGLINDIIRIGGTTAHRSPFDPASILSHFIAPPLSISCKLAVSDSRLLGFQALEWADPDWPGEDKIPADWAIIATYVDRSSQGMGIGRHLFGETLRAAGANGVTCIDATIRRENAAGLRYYSRLGFEDYRERPETVSKQFSMDGAPSTLGRERLDQDQT